MKHTKHQARPIRFIELEGGCFVQITHMLNTDGYFCKAWGNARTNNRRAEVFHRFIWRAHNGDIPEGYEVDHKCRNRACCNPDHLQAIPGPEHTALTNRTRYSERKEKARACWVVTKETGAALAKRTGFSQATACRWIREWKANEACHA